MDPLTEAALDAISKVFADTSVSPAYTIDRLEYLADEIDAYIQAIEGLND